MFHTIEGEIQQHLCPFAFRNLITDRTSQLVRLFILALTINPLSCKSKQQWTSNIMAVTYPTGKLKLLHMSKIISFGKCQ